MGTHPLKFCVIILSVRLCSFDPKVICLRNQTSALEDCTVGPSSAIVNLRRIGFHQSGAAAKLAVLGSQHRNPANCHMASESALVSLDIPLEEEVFVNTVNSERLNSEHSC